MLHFFIFIVLFLSFDSFSSDITQHIPSALVPTRTRIDGKQSLFLYTLFQHENNDGNPSFAFLQKKSLTEAKWHSTTGYAQFAKYCCNMNFTKSLRVLPKKELLSMFDNERNKIIKAQHCDIIQDIRKIGAVTSKQQGLYKALSVEIFKIQPNPFIVEAIALELDRRQLPTVSFRPEQRDRSYSI